MEDGLVESSVTKTVVQGEARVGKSSVKSLLVSEPYTDDTSTNCIEPPCVAVRCYGHTGKYWERINEEEMGIKVIAAVQSGAMKKSESQSHADEMDLSQDRETNVNNKSNAKKQQKDASKASKFRNESVQPMDHDFSSSAVTSDASTVIELTSDSSEKDAVVRVRKFYQKCKMNQKEGTSLHGRRWLYFIDSGGQIQFQKLLPAFMPYASVLLLVVNLSKNLTDPSSTAMQLSEREISVGQHSLSVIEILKHLLSAIASSAQRYRSLIADDHVLSKYITPPSDKLKVLPVATYRDQYEEPLMDGKESIDDKREIINKILHHHETCEIVGREGRIYLYEVDGRKARDKVFENLQPDSDLYKIAQALEDNAYQIKVPLKWYCFGVLLHDVAKEGCGVLSLSYCQKLGQQLKVNLSPEESLSAIKFLSFLNKLLFYPDSPAGDLVFVNIESLIEILRDLLVFVYDAHSDAKFLLPDQKALVCKGHLSNEILKKASKSCNKISEAFSDFDAKLLGLFEYLLIATKLTEKDTFFMPALLPIIDVADINPYHNTTPLLLYFESAIPMGLFCAVIVHLLSHKESPWKVVEESNFSNYFTLRCPDLLESNIALVEQLDCIAVYCKTANDYLPARDAVEEAVDVAMSKHKLSTGEKPKRAFYCPCGKGRHAAVADWLKRKRYVFRCTIDYEPQNMATNCLSWLDHTSMTEVKRYYNAYFLFIITIGKRQHDELQHLPDALETSEFSLVVNVPHLLIIVYNSCCNFILDIAYKILVDSRENIKKYFAQDFSQIADKLFQKGVITVAEKDYITDRNTGQSEYQRMDELLKHVIISVEIEASVFSIFVEILKEKGTLAAVKFSEKLTKKYNELSSLVNLESSSKRSK